MGLDYEFMWKAFPDILSYLPVTLKLTAGALILSVPFALLFAMIQIRKVPLLRKIVSIYLSLIRGTPIILQIFVIYNLMPYLLQKYADARGMNLNIYDLNGMWYAYIALSLSATAFLTEAFRASIETVDKGQFEAACMVGMSRGQAYRRIIFPQAAGVAMPVITNVVVDTIKATSLAFAMAVTEVTGRAKILGGENLRYFEAYLDIFLVYVIVIGITEILLKKLEKYCVRYRVA
ncbi:MAG: amino acid ABC transporter permease [Butyrivibrio sp.]|jgi:His/Glu/Gln/Arg/opine family amino acid ABC transporter permease subunit|nr:amino acid ABC transporter permease [Butyrivibrio sp.]